MFRSKKGLILYQLILSSFTILVALAIILKPDEGWSNRFDKWRDSWQTHSLPAAASENTSEKDVQYEVDAELNTSASLVQGTSVIHIPSVPDQQVLFYLYPSTFKPMVIQQVQVNDKTVAAQIASDHILIPVKEKGSPATIRIRFTTPIPVGGTRLGTKDGVWSLTYWYPILGVYQNGAWVPRPRPLPFGDPYLMDLASYRVRLKHPANFQWYTSGTLLSSKKDDGVAISEWKVERIRNFALIGGTGWQEAAWKTQDGVDVKVAARNPKLLPNLQNIAESSVKTYTKRFGSLAYKQLSVIEMPSGTVYAHEYPNLALFSEDIWNWGNGERWISHEIAHGWWFSSVGTYKALNPWLDEGLAEYASLLYLESKYGQSTYKQAISQSWKLFSEGRSNDPHQYRAQVYVNDQKLDLPYKSFSDDASYYYLMYLRPTLMYHDLRTAMGEQKFFQFLQQFYLKNKLDTATRQKLEEALQSVDPNALPRLKMWLDLPNGELINQVKDRFAD